MQAFPDMWEVTMDLTTRKKLMDAFRQRRQAEQKIVVTRNRQRLQEEAWLKQMLRAWESNQVDIPDSNVQTQAPEIQLVVLRDCAPPTCSSRSTTKLRKNQLTAPTEQIATKFDLPEANSPEPEHPTKAKNINASVKLDQMLPAIVPSFQVPTSGSDFNPATTVTFKTEPQHQEVVQVPITHDEPNPRGVRSDSNLQTKIITEPTKKHLAGAQFDSQLQLYRLHPNEYSKTNFVTAMTVPEYQSAQPPAVKAPDKTDLSCHDLRIKMKMSSTTSSVSIVPTIPTSQDRQPTNDAMRVPPGRKRYLPVTLCVLLDKIHPAIYHEPRYQDDQTGCQQRPLERQRKGWHPTVPPDRMAQAQSISKPVQFCDPKTTQSCKLKGHLREYLAIPAAIQDVGERREPADQSAAIHRKRCVGRTKRVEIPQGGEYVRYDRSQKPHRDTDLKKHRDTTIYFTDTGRNVTQSSRESTRTARHKVHIKPSTEKQQQQQCELVEAGARK